MLTLHPDDESLIWKPSCSQRATDVSDHAVPSDRMCLVIPPLFLTLHANSPFSLSFGERRYTAFLDKRRTEDGMNPPQVKYTTEYHHHSHTSAIKA